MKNYKKIIIRYYESIKFLKFRQVKFRLIYIFKKKIYKFCYFKLRSYTGPINNNSLKINYKIEINKQFYFDINNLTNGKIKVFSNYYQDFDINNPNWHDLGKSYRLINFKINSLEFLHILTADVIINKSESSLNFIEHILSTYILESQKYDLSKDFWNSYLISNRSYNIIGVLSGLRNLINDDLVKDLECLLDFSRNHLLKNIEFHLGANHLLTDAKGIIALGSYFDDEKSMILGFELMVNEMEEQFSTDNMHYERSISYHIEAILQIIESISCVQGIESEAIKTYKNKLLNSLKKYTIALMDFLKDDFTFPLINDSSLDYPISLGDLKSVLNQMLNGEESCRSYDNFYYSRLADSLPILTDNQYIRNQIVNKLYKDYGYYLLKDEKKYLLVNVGNPTPSYNLGHTHSDSLNVIYSKNGKNILVDSGTYTYENIPKRLEYKSSCKHNTVSVDGLEIHDIWSNFRIGRRASSKVVNLELNEDVKSISISHNGFSKGGVDLVRNLVISENELIIKDIITNKLKRMVTVNYFTEINKIYVNSDYEIILGDSVKVSSNLPIKFEKVNGSKYFNVEEDFYRIYSETNDISSKIYYSFKDII